MFLEVIQSLFLIQKFCIRDYRSDGIVKVFGNLLIQSFKYLIVFCHRFFNFPLYGSFCNFYYLSMSLLHFLGFDEFFSDLFSEVIPLYLLKLDLATDKGIFMLVLVFCLFRADNAIHMLRGVVGAQIVFTVKDNLISSTAA